MMCHIICHTAEHDGDDDGVRGKINDQFIRVRKHIIFVRSLVASLKGELARQPIVCVHVCRKQSVNDDRIWRY